MAEEQIELFDDETLTSIPDKSSEDSPDEAVGTLCQFVQEKFTRAVTARFHDEQRWMQAYRNYRGVYGPDVKFTEAEKSRIFVKVTKTKVLASYSQISDVILGSDNFPISVMPTQLPNGMPTPGCHYGYLSGDGWWS